MTTGIPGAGIGGLFYLAATLFLPVRGVLRRARGGRVAWQVIIRQVLIALGILLGIWVAGWAVGLWLGPAFRPIPSRLAGLIPAGASRTTNALGGVALVVGVGTLVVVLLLVQVARLVVRRPRRAVFPLGLLIGLVAAGSLHAQRADRPAVEPAASYQRDSDAYRTYRFALLADAALAAGLRLGVGGSYAVIQDAVGSAVSSDGFLRLALRRPRFGPRFDLAAGAARLTPEAGTSWATVTGTAHVRWHGGPRRPAVELRGQRAPVGYAPFLVEQQVVRTEVRGQVEAPVGPVRLRAGGRLGSLDAVGESNARRGLVAAVVRPLGWRGAASAQYHSLSYARASNAGYFAPRRVETVEGGFAYELGDLEPLVISVDLGLGSQRLAEHGANLGAWRLALRGYVWMAVLLAPGRTLVAELEGYDTPFAPDGVLIADRWRFVSVTLGLRWSL